MEVVNKTISLSEMSTWRSGILLASFHRQIRKITDEYLKKFDLTTMHWLIIGAILEEKDQGIRITDLANKIDTTVGYLTNSVNNLELKNMIVRVDHDMDNRTKLLLVPDSFRDTCLEIENGLRNVYRNEFYKKITREELAIYNSVLQKLSS